METNLSIDIELLLENAELDKSNYFSVNHNPYVIGQVTSAIYTNEYEYDLDIVHKQTLDISKIFYQQNKKNQVTIEKILLDKLSTGGEVTKTVVSVFFQIGASNKLLEYIKANFTSKQLSYFQATKHLNEILFLFWSAFNKSDIKAIRSWSAENIKGENALGIDISQSLAINNPYKLLFKSIYNQTNHILVVDVRQRISAGFNPEINIDEEELKKEFTKFGFNPDLSEVLDKIDQKFNTSKDAFDFKGCMDLLRSFTERLYRSILDQYGVEGKSVHEQDSNEVAKFFKNNNLIGSDFADMVISQRHFLSNLASHRLKSREDDARLSKNMVIEMSLYIMKRFQNH